MQTVPHHLVPREQQLFLLLLLLRLQSVNLIGGHRGMYSADSGGVIRICQLARSSTMFIFIAGAILCSGR